MSDELVKENTRLMGLTRTILQEKKELALQVERLTKVVAEQLEIIEESLRRRRKALSEGECASLASPGVICLDLKGSNPVGPYQTEIADSTKALFRVVGPSLVINPIRSQDLADKLVNLLNCAYQVGTWREAVPDPRQDKEVSTVPLEQPGDIDVTTHSTPDGFREFLQKDGTRYRKGPLVSEQRFKLLLAFGDLLREICEEYNLQISAEGGLILLRELGFNYPPGFAWSAAFKTMTPERITSDAGACLDVFCNEVAWEVASPSPKEAKVNFVESALREAAESYLRNVPVNITTIGVREHLKQALADLKAVRP